MLENNWKKKDALSSQDIYNQSNRVKMLENNGEKNHPANFDFNIKGRE